MPSVLSLFTGAGGLDLGLEAAGFEVALAVECNKQACATIRMNRAWPVFEGNIHDLSSERIRSAYGVRPEGIDLLAGGPPCQPFSKSAYWSRGDTKRLDDPRADTLTAYLRILRDFRPKAFLLENVEGLAFRGKDEGFLLLKDTIEAINRVVGTSYTLSMNIVNMADFGVPQTRTRVFLIGHRDGKSFRFPSPTHADSSEVASGDVFTRKLSPWITAWDAIGDLEDSGKPDSVGGKWGRLLPSIPEGENYLHHTDRGSGLPLFGWRRRYWGFLLKLSKRRPAWTIQAQPGTAIGPFHWRNRRLSVREMCRLQTIPDDYGIAGGISEAQRQLGNAVPSLMTEVIGREIRRQLLGQSHPEGELRLAIARRAPIPDAEPTKPVPDDYLQLVGEHAAHPGTGKGHLVKGK